MEKDKTDNPQENGGSDDEKQHLIDGHDHLGLELESLNDSLSKEKEANVDESKENLTTKTNEDPKPNQKEGNEDDIIIEMRVDNIQEEDKEPYVTQAHSNGNDKGNRQSLMHDVRKRMKRSGNVPYLVPGTKAIFTTGSSRSGKYSSKSSNRSKKESLVKKEEPANNGRTLSSLSDDTIVSESSTTLEPPKTCGCKCVISYTNLVLLSFACLIIVTATVILIYEVFSATEVAKQSEAFCSNATGQLINATSEVILTSASKLGTSIALTVSIELSTTVKQAISLTTSIFDYLFALVYTNPDQACLTQIEAALNVFMYLQASSAMYQYIDYIELALTNGGYLDYNICSADEVGCINTRATNYSTNSIVRCMLIGTSNLQNGNELPLSTNCTTFEGYNIKNLIEYQLVQNVSNAAGPNGTLSGGWTDFYIFPNATLNPILNPVAGVAFAFPSSFNCLTFGCMNGVISSKIATYSIATMLYRVSKGVFTIWELRASTPGIYHNDSVAYIIERNDPQSGALLGGYLGDSTLIAPTTLTFAASYTEAPEISETAAFLQSIAPFSSSYYDTPTSSLFNSSTGTACNADQNLTNILPCLSIITSPINVTSSFTNASYRLKWLIVVIIPIKAVVNQTLTELNEVEQQLDERQEQSILLIRDIIVQSILVTVACIIISILLSFFLSFVITKSLSKISKAMEKLLRFDFSDENVDENGDSQQSHGEREEGLQVPVKRELSRVKDIAAVQRVFYSLKDSFEIFTKFVPETVVRNIVAGGRGRKLFVDERVVTIMFSDVKGFTSIAEKLPQQELLYFLVKYLTVMTFIVESFDGVVAEILGDGLLVFWNTPDDVAFHESKACAAALSQQHAMKTIIAKEFKEIFESYGLDPEPSIRIGIHTGKVLSGNIGSEIKMKFGCLGDAVNLASRLEGLCKLYGVGIILSESTKKNLPQIAEFRTRKLDVVQVKGKDDPTTLYELVSMEGYIEDFTPKKKWNEPVTQKKKANEIASRVIFKNPLRKLTFRASKKMMQNPENMGVTKVDDEKRIFGPITYLDLVPEGSEIMKVKNIEGYEEALMLYQQGKFQEAKDLLNGLTEDTEAGKYLMQRIDEAMLHATLISTSTWNGINRLNEKNF